MADANPFAPPQARVDVTDADSAERLEKLASGQKLVIWGIILSIGSLALQFAIGPFAFVLGIVSFIMSVIGVLRLANGFGYGTGRKIVYIIGLFIPLLSLVMLIVLSVRATRHLREGGYTVGLFGASKTSVLG
ncbi:MAG: hypothetical protein ACKVQQ_22630 [Burkholderiales bacterium]